MLIRTRIVSWFQASAITVWPFIFIDPLCADDETTLKHERVHLAQQRRWAIYGLGVGLLIWFLAYLLFLPLWRNPLRRKSETEAYKLGNGLDDATIAELLCGAPYYLRKKS